MGGPTRPGIVHRLDRDTSGVILVAKEEQTHRELGGADDVRRRGVDDHDARLGRRRDVDVVEADARAGDHLEARRGGQGLGVDLRGGAHEHGVDVGKCGQQLGSVGPVAVPDLEVRAEGLDRGGGQLFGDEDDRLAHVGTLLSLADRRTTAEGRRRTGVGKSNERLVNTFTTPTSWNGRRVGPTRSHRASPRARLRLGSRGEPDHRHLLVASRGVGPPGTGRRTGPRPAG